MKKGIIITGEAGSGKTTLARSLASQINGDTVFISGRRKSTRLYSNPFMFKYCTPETSVIIIDDVVYTCVIDWILSFISEPITVDRRNEKPFTITPLFIITCDENIKKEYLEKLGSSFQRRFSILNLEKAEPITPECPHTVIFKDADLHRCGTCGLSITDLSNYKD
jgi:energy-coupling factor transporter ATP-binding protein EcfA2